MKGIPVPFDIVKAPFVQKGDGIAVASVRPIIPYKGDWLLVETSTDTVYNYVSKENKLCPFLVKTPSENPEILLTMGAVTERYYFMQTIHSILIKEEDSLLSVWCMTSKRMQYSMLLCVMVTLLNCKV